MAIINRLARLFKADFHAVLDHIEEPELQLKQAIREMDEQCQANQRKLRQLMTKAQELSSSISDAQTLLDKTEQEITVCFNSDNDQLAKGLVRRKLETNALIQSLTQARESNEKQRASCKKEGDEFASLLSGMQQKAALMSRQNNQTAPYSESHAQVNDNDVEIALLQEKQRYQAQLKNA